MESYKVKVAGTRPLLMHAIPVDGFGQGGRPGVRPEPRGEAEKALYKDNDGNIGVPAFNLLSCLKMAAKEFRVPGKGKVSYTKYILSGLEITPDFIPLSSDGKPPKEAWQLDLRPVVVQRARIIRARPRFDKWGLEFGVNILDPIVRGETVVEILKSAGKYVGLCDLRPLLGLFQVESFERIV